jgi:hypothetical protein
MAHFAELDKDNIVVRVVVVPDEHQHRGHDFLSEDLDLGGRWVQTSYNGSMRKKYAGIGDTFDERRDAFIPPKPHDSWLMDEATCLWNAPIAKPTDGKRYDWDEDTLSWVEDTLGVIK